jgi:hypothetical protein
MFADTVGAAGNSGWLLQRPVERWGHCAFTTDETASAFATLVSWVRSGQRP